MAGLASMGVKVRYAAGSTVPDTAQKVQGSTMALPNCVSCPSLGGDTEQIDVTSLSDSVKKYIPGLKDYGNLEFKFLYDGQETLSAFNICKTHENTGNPIYYVVELPAKAGYSFGGAFWFQAIPTTGLDEVAVNDRLTWTLSLALQSDVTYIEPVRQNG